MLDDVAHVLTVDLPDEAYLVLRRRAEKRGLSLQQYLVEELTHLANRPSLEELFERIESRSGGRVGATQAVDDLTVERADRSRR